MPSSHVIIIDSGICNLFNVRMAFESLGSEVVITQSRETILGAERVVLPGVGAFGPGMHRLDQFDLIETLADYAKSGKPLLGICLGMQMLMSVSEEQGIRNGLGLISGKVRKLRGPSPGQNFKIPQIGWNTLERNEPPWEKTLLDGLEHSPHVYFVHSYVVEPDNADHVLAHTHYGQDRFCSVIKKDNISGCQFHPERSGKSGLKILQNFLKE